MIFSIENSYQERRLTINDETIYQRIIKAYNKSKKEQETSSSIYQVNNEWLPIYNHHLGEIIDNLKEGNIKKISEIYSNFFRENCSSGLHGLTLSPATQFINNEIHPELRTKYFHDTLHRVNLWLDLTEQQIPITELQSNQIGNPYGYTLDSTFIRAGAEYQHYYATIINRLTKSSSRPTILEIGGGFGGMAYYLMKQNPNITYINIDLPENIALSSFYLINSFPQKRFALYGEINPDSTNLKEYDGILIPNTSIEKVKENSVDLTFNSYSLAEMSSETIELYIRTLSKFTSKFFFHINHTKNSIVKSSEFPIDRTKFELLYKAPALWNMGRNPQMDEFEFLYKNKNLSFTTSQD